MVEWNQILLKREYDPEDPDAIVVNLASVLEERKAERILDLGCGAGRHVVYLAEHGFETYGVDISEIGLKTTKKRLKRRKLGAEVARGDMKSIPCVDFCFDAVICVRTIYHQKLRGLRETISEIHRILKEKGLFLANFHSKRSGKYGRGVEVEEDTFMQEDGAEKGVLHHFLDERELRELLENFEIDDFEISEKMIGNYLQSRFTILAEKV